MAAPTELALDVKTLGWNSTIASGVLDAPTPANRHDSSLVADPGTGRHPVSNGKLNL